MGDDKHKHGGISASLEKVGAGNNVRRQLDAGKVSMIIIDKNLKRLVNDYFDDCIG
jgi:hypothetical protein